MLLNFKSNLTERNLIYKFTRVAVGVTVRLT